MEALIGAIVELAVKLVTAFSDGDAEKERQALLTIASRTADEAFKRSIHNRG